MPGEDALFAAILENPDDDRLRLALADSLDGDPRAEFIRVQCELAKVPRDRALPTFRDWLFEDWNCDLPSLTSAPVELLDRERQLLDLHEEAWIRSVQESVRPCRTSPGELRDFLERPKRIEKPLYGWQFHRGLVDTVWMEARAFVNDADHLFRSAPVRNVWLYRPAGLIKSLVALPGMARLEALDLGGTAIYHHNMDCITDADLGALASCPSLYRLTTLGLSCHAIGGSGVEAL
ncbi:MAG TPA: TIGR02996 domain-containing protein, partial [Thermoanaerobaculia bacterium]